MINCNTLSEAKRLGRLCLRNRLAACFSIFKRQETMYYWPPLAGRLIKGGGVLLILETIPARRRQISTLIKKYHTDKLPFIGMINLEVESAFATWLKKEIK